MKFLCDNCKAKYQIADEKVAGKTVRMKCRKCGHQIEVRAAVTETSVTSSPPRAPGTLTRPPRPGGGLATSLSATKPRPPSPSNPPSALAGAFQRNVHDVPASVAPGAMTPHGPRSATIELSVTDEWYVAINGVPVGPVRISELRRKAAVGAVTEESLCWQEGLEEWRPIRSIPELAAIVREAGLGNRPSLVAPEPPPRASVPPPPRPPPHRASTPPPRPVTPSAPSVSRSNVVPLRPDGPGGSRPAFGPAAAHDDMGHSSGTGGGGIAAALAPMTSPSMTPHPLAPMFTPQPQPLSLPPPTIDPFAVPAPAVPAGMTPPPGGAYRDSIAPGRTSFHPPAEAPRRAGVPLWFWPILLLALGFGGGVAFIVFRPQAPAPVVIQMPPTATAPAATGPEKTDTAPPPPSSDPAPPESAPKGGKVATRSGKAPTPAEEKRGLDLGNLAGGTGGPNVGPTGAAGAGGGGLDQAAVERVVAGHRAGVKRTCWERGGADTKSSVNVTVTANVAPNGTVASTSSAGDDPVVGKCIENQVRSWSFPAPGSTTTLNIPFKFVRQ